MSNLEMEKSFSVKRKISDCFLYTTDFSTIWEWDQTILSSSKISDGKIDVGTKFEVLLNFGIQPVKMDYEVIKYEYPYLAVLKGVSKNFIAVDTISMESIDDLNTKINWKATIEFKGIIGSLLPLMKNKIIENGYKTIDNLQLALQNDINTPHKSGFSDALILPRIWKFSKYGYSNARDKWHPNSASIKGKNILITGASSGIGLAAATEMAHKAAHLTLVIRDKKKGDTIKKFLLEKTGNPNVNIEYCDLSLISEVKLLANRLIKKEQSVDVLINNAGALFNEKSFTKEGIEQSFALLLLSPFVLTELLIPLMSKNSRVINITSGGMYTQRLNVNNLESNLKSYNGSIAYANCKRGLDIVTKFWAKKYEKTGITFNAMHPGWADTPGVLNALPVFHKITKRILRTPEEGADTINWLASSSEAGQYNGQLFMDRTIQPSHLFSKTQESENERILLTDKLCQYLN